MIYQLTIERMNRWMNEWEMDEWTNGWIDQRCCLLVAANHFLYNAIIESGDRYKRNDVMQKDLWVNEVTLLIRRGYWM